MECYQDENYNSNYISVLISKPTFLFTIILETNLFLSMWSAYQKKCGKNLVFEKKAFHRLNQLILPKELKILFFQLFSRCYRRQQTFYIHFWPLRTLAASDRKRNFSFQIM